MMSSQRIRLVERQTVPFSAIVIIKGEVASPWAQAKAEAMLTEQIQAQIGPNFSLETLKKMGVYTVEFGSKTHHYIHRVDAPDGIRMQVPEPIPNWWEAVDDFPIARVPNGNGLTIALLPTVTRDYWRRSDWPDRPHP